jgi:signal transduction histidine kinase
LDLAQAPLTIRADASQITQVLLNVCVNARDAMPDGGSLRLKTSVVDGTALQVPDDLQTQSYVAIEVIDTGMGMEESVLSKIFEPFFTTKEVGKGTGLGLAVAYGIVKGHGGVIQVESEPLHGTSFNLYFPMVSASENLFGMERK